MKMVAVFAVWFFLVARSEPIEGSGEGVEIDPDLEIIDANSKDPYTVLMNRLKQKNDFIVPTPLNATLQLQLVRAENELYRGRIGLTLWLHQSWTDPDFEFAQSDGITRLLLPLDKILARVQHPDPAIKNALYFHEHATPALNAFLAVYPNGTLVSHRKVTVDLPCDKQFVPSESGQVHYNYGIRGVWQNSCRLQYGSYSRAKDMLTLRWHPIAIVEQKVPCGLSAARTSGSCEILQTTTSNHVEDFAGEVYDEIVAEFQIESTN